jgi:hypothetical protein
LNKQNIENPRKHGDKKNGASDPKTHHSDWKEHGAAAAGLRDDV